MILKFQKVTDEYTTHTLVEPDYSEGDARVTELCTIGDDTYVHVPDDMVLPGQPVSVEAGMETIVLTDELRTEIKAMSPHIGLINTRVVEKIRLKYSATDETKIHSDFMADGLTDDTQAYLDYRAECRVWGTIEKEKIGL